MEDELSKKQLEHQVGMELDELSVEELDQRILLLQGEIERLNGAIKSKKAALTSAQTFFKI